MNTIQELNRHWWYRLIKAAYLILLVLSLAYGTWSTYQTYRPWDLHENTFVNPPVATSTALSPSTSTIIIPPGYTLAEPPGTLSVNDITSTVVTVGSYSEAIWRSILAFLLILAAFEVIRRIFYYVALGSIRPRRDI